MEQLHVNTPTSVEDPEKKNHAKPTDFVRFVPWACRELGIQTEVIVIRAAQKTYVSASVKNKKMGIKPKKQPSLLQSTNDSGAAMSSVFYKPRYNENVVVLETVYDINENLVQLKILKNKTIPRNVMQIIALAIPFQPNLTSIIINSGLHLDSLYEMSKFLPKSQITELCLDGTFLSQANYHILLSDSKLKHLSLTKCTINDAIVKTIADQLKDPLPASKGLSVLNLSSNRITDVGAKYLADMLRTNRQLSYLNLAGNMITDEGGMRILDTLHTFPLHAQELLESRAKYVAYLKQKNSLINTLIIELQTTKIDKSSKKKVTKKGKLDNLSQQLTMSLEKPYIETGVDAQIIHDKAAIMADKKLGIFIKPFSPTNTTTQNGVVHCFGNNVLCYLNVAYNNITYATVKKLHQVLSSQQLLNRNPRGLIKVVIEGNLIPVACKEFEEIDRFLGFRKQSDSTTKRKVVSAKSSGK